MTLVDLAEAHTPGIGDLRAAAADILFRAFAAIDNPTWPDMPSAQAEVADCLHTGFIALGLVENSGDRLVAWGGLRPMYGAHTWELHPLVVDPREQGKGYGAELLRHLEGAAAHRGVAGIVLGSDDETASTSLSAVDFEHTAVGDAIANIVPRPGRPVHPYRFYQRQGYRIVGVIPDATGPGRPDILMWKPLHRD